MTLKEFANVDSFYRDKTTGKEIEWHEYMGRVIKNSVLKISDHTFHMT